MFVYKIDVLEELKKIGYNQNQLRVKNLIGQSGITKLRRGEIVSLQILETICKLLNKQPGSIIKWVPDPVEESEK